MQRYDLELRMAAARRNARKRWKEYMSNYLGVNDLEEAPELMPEEELFPEVPEDGEDLYSQEG